MTGTGRLTEKKVAKCISGWSGNIKDFGTGLNRI
jgi:hypothetical protein